MLGDHVRLFEDCETSTALGTLGSATAAHPKMHLYNLTLKKASAVTACVQGQFSDAGVNEIVVSRGKILELLRQDKETNKMVSITTIEVFGYIRKLVTSRLPGATKDHIVLSSDSGKVSVLEYNNTQGKFVVLQCETFGKTGIRRITPGEYLAADIKGRAIMIGAVEKQKFVYVFNRDAAARLTISSPLEAHRSQTINFDIVAVDVDFDNPQFACLEVDYTPVDEDPVGEAAAGLPKTLAFYELDLGLNHVVRKSSEEVSHTANLLITVPGGAAGPSGVLVCAENKISYFKPGHADDVFAIIPRRVGTDINASIIITSAVTLKQKKNFFFLLQSDIGDVYRVSLEQDGDTVAAINMHYFETLPVAACMAVLRSGYLFLATEMGAQRLYHFSAIGDDAEEEIITEVHIGGEVTPVPHFNPRSLKFLTLADDCSPQNLFPLVDMQVADLAGEVTPQIYSLCGTRGSSALRVLRQGLPVDVVAQSALPHQPICVWTLKTRFTDVHHSYIVVSFQSATFIMTIGETIQDTQDSGLIRDAATLHVAPLGDDSILQACANTLHHVSHSKRFVDWKPPFGKLIECASSNRRQAIVVLTGSDTVYFELNAAGLLTEVYQRLKVGGEICAVDLAPVPSGRQRASFGAIGILEGGTWVVRIVSIDGPEPGTVVSRQFLTCKPSSVALVTFSKDEEPSSLLYLFVGLVSGVVLRISVDPKTGVLGSDSRMRCVGTKPVSIFKVRVADVPGVACVSNRIFLAYSHNSRPRMTALSTETVDAIAGFSAEICPSGFVSVDTATKTLRIFSLERLGDDFNQRVVNLQYTPRRMAVCGSGPKYLLVVEADCNVTSAPLLQLPQSELDIIAGDADMAEPSEEDIVERKRRLASSREVFGNTRPGNSVWASCITLFDSDTQISDRIELDNNEAAFCCACVDFAQEQVVVVGTARDVIMSPRSCSSASLRTYRVVDGKLVLVHVTAMKEIPTALCGFKDHLIVGMAGAVRVYDSGKKQLLRKCESRDLPSTVLRIVARGNRLFAADQSESVFMLRFDAAANVISAFADDTTPRWTTCIDAVDADTAVGGDKFGNLFVLRLPSDVSKDVEADASIARFRYDNSHLHGCPHKMDCLAAFHCGEVVTSVQRAALQTGGTEAVIYSGILGTVGALVPFTTRDDVDFFTHLEMYVRQEAHSVVGRDHLMYRSYYVPVKDVIDGDLCECFNILDPAKQKQIADELERTPGEVTKKLEDMRNRLM